MRLMRLTGKLLVRGASAFALALALSVGVTPWAAAQETPRTGETGGLEDAPPAGPVLEIETQRGVITVQTYPGDAPKTVARITELARSGFYDGVTFHRVVPGFVVQGGDPTGTGRGGSGRNLPAEFNDRKHVAGTVAMARAQDPDSADSQFYITLGPQPSLDGKYTVFGLVIDGMATARALKVGDVMMHVTVRE